MYLFPIAVPKECDCNHPRRVLLILGEACLLFKTSMKGMQMVSVMLEPGDSILSLCIC